MKKQTRWIIAAVCLLLVLTLGVGLYIRSTQMAGEKAGAITLNLNGKGVTVTLKDLNQAAFEGETVNGKGDRSTHAYRGVELKALLTKNGLDAAKVTAVTASSADQYTAELTGDEIREDKRVYVAVEIDGKAVEGIDAGTNGAQLVVFGDPNSRRNVRYLSVIDVTGN